MQACDLRHERRRIGPILVASGGCCLVYGCFQLPRWQRPKRTTWRRPILGARLGPAIAYSSEGIVCRRTYGRMLCKSRKLKGARQRWQPPTASVTLICDFCDLTRCTTGAAIVYLDPPFIIPGRLKLTFRCTATKSYGPSSSECRF